MQRYSSRLMCWGKADLYVLEIVFWTLSTVAGKTIASASAIMI